MRQFSALSPVAYRRDAGDILGVALPALHADPQIWPDPGRFDPERFLSAGPHLAEYSPFGYGHRRCPGSSFAALELAIVLGTILTNVELRIPDRKRRAKLPRSIPRGVAAVPSRADHARCRAKSSRRFVNHEAEAACSTVPMVVLANGRVSERQRDTPGRWATVEKPPWLSTSWPMPARATSAACSTPSTGSRMRSRF